ncbi:MAG TPA: leucine-rich repeat domain-containing protein [Thioploca sp.]|nr:MAG: hypothetical protein DRR19_17770 [Gammaproteobacteria bacterium]HDN26647.1 leucine-rich repeat domain-containing protein [Thioploca sp.]
METEILNTIIAGIFTLLAAVIVILFPRWLDRKDQRKPQTDEKQVPQDSPHIFNKRKWWEQLDDNWKKVFKNAIYEKGMTNFFKITLGLKPSDSDLDKIFLLQKLNCGCNEISDLETLRPLTQLQVLICSNNSVSDLEPLRLLTQLQHLDCNSNKISCLEPLRSLTQLRKLYCGNNQISHLESIRPLTQLQELYCGWNHISDLEPLLELVHLQILYCSENQLSQLEIDKFKEAVPNCKLL